VIPTLVLVLKVPRPMLYSAGVDATHHAADPDQQHRDTGRARSLNKTTHTDFRSFIGQACDEPAAATASRLMRHGTTTSRPYPDLLWLQASGWT